MSSRITEKDILRLVSIISKITGEEYEYQEGSPTYGNAWRLYRSGWSPFDLSNGCLGWSRREAIARLEGILGGLRHQRMNDGYLGDSDLAGRVTP